jgi:hypothetical protein
MAPALGEPFWILGHGIVDATANPDLPELVASTDTCINCQEGT